MKTVYTCFCTDVIHEGHLNIIRNARNYGKVIVGALSDEALIRFNKFPTISLEERINLYRKIQMRIGGLGQQGDIANRPRLDCACRVYSAGNHQKRTRDGSDRLARRRLIRKVNRAFFCLHRGSGTPHEKL